VAILVAAAAALPGQTLGSAGDAAVALESVLGGWGAKVAFSIGLAAAGLTSAITAPLAAAYAVSGVCGWPTDPKAWSFRALWGGVLLAGLLAAIIFGASPTQTIVIAQAANALVLPVIAIILLMACNAKLLGKYANTTLHNSAAVAVILVVLLLSISKYLL
jgi:Mn2+/Fe2+ NRAMP family transporter